jgi:vancomycin resistance protein YoaR
MRSQAIPIAEYRRRAFYAQVGPPALALTLATIVFTVGLAVWQYLVLPGITPQHLILDSPLSTMFKTAPRPVIEKNASAEGVLVAPAIPESSIVSQGRASLGGVGGNAVKNMRIAINFLDGEVIAPGQQLSFDDVAQSWDFKEHYSYLPSYATSARGPIMMRGGGVCWVSTALWRAALAAGLATDVRENHYGYVAPLGAGLDATNTLVIRNNSSIPITVRAWEESGAVAVALIADGELDRKAEVSEPTPTGRGSYVVYQTVYWDDGDVTTHPFYSRYFW